jgi:tetrahydromethanopterin S-methyltransferase subunit E
MSQFSLGGGLERQIGMRRKIGDVFQGNDELTHIYDFGTSSETLVKLVGTREGKGTTSKEIALMARNQMPENVCIECGQPATHLCFECIIEEDTWGTLCDKHAKNHPHNNYDEPISLINSPRLGMCGYDGPAEPPY